eukprot:143208-Rhodomonas_salina.1
MVLYSALPGRYAMPGSELGYGVICLRACYAMPSTEVGYGVIFLHSCYAMPGTERGYGATRGKEEQRVWARSGYSASAGHICLRIGSALSSTDVANAVALVRYPAVLPACACATRCPVLTSRMMLPGRIQMQLEVLVRSPGMLSYLLPYCRYCSRVPGTDIRIPTAYPALVLRPYCHMGCAVLTCSVLLLGEEAERTRRR